MKSFIINMFPSDSAIEIIIIDDINDVLPVLSRSHGIQQLRDSQITSNNICQLLLERHAHWRWSGRIIIVHGHGTRQVVTYATGLWTMRMHKFPMTLARVNSFGTIRPQILARDVDDHVAAIVLVEAERHLAIITVLAGLAIGAQDYFRTVYDVHDETKGKE